MFRKDQDVRALKAHPCLESTTSVRTELRNDLQSRAQQMRCRNGPPDPVTNYRVCMGMEIYMVYKP